MTRNTDRLEILARDLASRYGENDRLVCEVRRSHLPSTPSAKLGHRAWRTNARVSFKPARLAKLGIGNSP
jgi:hypothetical protein